MQHPSFTADRNRNYNDFYGVLPTVNPYCLVLSNYSLATSQEVKQNKQKTLIHFSSAMWPVKLDVRGGHILSQIYKILRRVSEKAYWGMKVKLLFIIILRNEKKKHNDGLLLLLIKNDLFDPRDDFFFFAEREGTGSNYLGDKANWVMICCLVEKMPPN